MNHPAAPASPEADAAPLPLALQLYRQGRYAEALQQLEPAQQVEPGNPVVWHLSAACLKALGRAEEAEGCWRQALRLAPDLADAHYSLALLLHEQRRPDAAIDGYREVLRIDPRHVPALNNLGSALARLGRLEEALHCYEQAVSLNPDHAAAWHNLGRALGEVGRFDQAHRALEQAIQLTPRQRRARYYRSLANLKRIEPGEPHLPEMEALARELPALPDADRVQLHFALGKAYGDLGRRERSFEHLLAGNAAKRAQTPYDEAATLQQFERIAAAFTPELLAARRGGGDPSNVPVFILGMPRSGSTLAEQILASHPEVHGAGECEEFKNLVESVRLPDGRPLLPDAVAGLSDAGLRQLGGDYLKRLRARAPDAPRISDKTLDNFLHVGLIHLALPQARIIHTRRDAVDTCLSCFSQLFNGYHPYAYDLAELGRYWRAYDRLMAHWRRVLPAGVMLELDYEELVGDPEGQTRRLLDHCGLGWNQACLDFHRSSRPVHTASVMQVRQPIYRSSVQKWRAYGELLRPLLDALELPPGA